MMMDEKALGEFAEASSEPTADLIQQACKLRDTLDLFISRDWEPPGLRSIVRFATNYLENGHASKRYRGTAMDEGIVCGHTCPQHPTIECGHTCPHHPAIVCGHACPQRPAVVCGHTCPQHPTIADPSVWSRLPEELLERVFARLPAASICRLQCLSKRWQQKITGRSHFKIACAEMNSQIIALVHKTLSSVPSFSLALYDLNVDMWHLRKLDVCDRFERFQTPSTADGGLICFISSWEKDKEDLLQIVVCNPLTGDKRRLQRKGVKNLQVEMLQIMTNRNTSHYKVLVSARPARSSLHFSVELFDSQTDKWTTLERLGNDAPPGDLFFGIRYSWDSDDLDYSHFRPEVMGPCVIDCTRRKLNELNDDSRPSVLTSVPVQEYSFVTSVNQYALVRDRLFVLQKKAGRGEADEGNAAHGQVSTMEGHYCFTEYQMQTTHPHFVELRTVQCCHSRLPRDHDYDMTLCACKGFVFLVAHVHYRFGEEEIALLYDLTTDEWRVLPCLPFDRLFEEVFDINLLCSMRWDACSNP